MLNILLQIVLEMALLAAMPVDETNLAPQMLLRMEAPPVFLAPGMLRQSKAIVLAPAPVAVAIFVP
jgi:hypothetical protein